MAWEQGYSHLLDTSTGSLGTFFHGSKTSKFDTNHKSEVVKEIAYELLPQVFSTQSLRVGIHMDYTCEVECTDHPNMKCIL